MIRHTVLFKWTEEATDEQKRAVPEAISALPSVITSVRSYVFGVDLGLAPGTWDFAVTADFDDEAGYLAYRDAPEHRAVIEQYILPIAAQRVSVQFSY
jgi:hypothetical protein